MTKILSQESVKILSELVNKEIYFFRKNDISTEYENKLVKAWNELQDDNQK